MYKLLKDPYGNDAQTVRRVSDGACIPFDSANTDYQAYLKWVAAGNQPQAAG